MMKCRPYHFVKTVVEGRKEVSPRSIHRARAEEDLRLLEQRDETLDFAFGEILVGIHEKPDHVVHFIHLLRVSCNHPISFRRQVPLSGRPSCKRTTYQAHNIQFP